MCGCESWTIKKAECQRIDAFELWCWRRLLRVPWTASISNQSILKEINPEYSLEGLMLQYFGHLMQRGNSLEKTLMLGKIEGRRRKGVIENEMAGCHHWFNGHEFEQILGDSLECCSPWVPKKLDRTEQLNWTGQEESGNEQWEGLASRVKGKPEYSGVLKVKCGKCSWKKIHHLG